MYADQPLRLLFVDVEKAYDSVPLKNVWRALEHYNISNCIIRTINRPYENSFSKIKIGKHLPSGFYVTKRLRKGCNLSPTLFKIYIQNALVNWQKKCARIGLEIQDTTIYSMLFADDQLIIAQAYEELEYMTRKIIEEHEVWGLKLNVKKLNIIIIYKHIITK
jgi:hypothetical protein